MSFRSAALALLFGIAIAGVPSSYAQTAPVPVPVPVMAARTGSLKAFDAKIEATKAAMMGDPSIARKTAEQAVHMAQTLAADRTVDARDAAIALATARWLLGEALIGLNDTANAKSLIGQALAGVERADPGSKLNGDLLRSRATLAETSGDVQGALKDYLQAYRIFRATGQARSQAIALQDIGNLYLEAQDFERVRQYYSQSLEAYSKDPWLNLATYNNRGQSYFEQNRFAEAEKEYALALASARELESPLLEARILTNLADAQANAGQLDQALRTITSANGLVQSGEGLGWRPFVYGVRARIEARRGNMAGAGRLFTTAFAGQDLDRTEMPFRKLHREAAEVYEKLGQGNLALAHWKAFQRLDSEALQLIASASSQLISARFDFANQNLRIATLKQGQLQRDILIERQRTQFRTNLFAGLGVALLVIFGLLSFGYISIRRSRDRVRAANTELSATNIALEKALKARTDFLATTSHEIRTPLNGILGMTQVMLADRRLEGDMRERVQLLLGAGETMKTLVDDILDTAKMEAGELGVDKRDIDLSALLSETTRLWRQTAIDKGLTLTCALDEVPAHVSTDGARLRQILSNLLSNAIKFTHAGEVRLVGRGIERNGQRIVEFSVHDTGIGISPEDQVMIFEAFTQVNNSTTRQFSGTGLGLAISQRLAMALGGGITVSSMPGEGSSFTLALPLDPIGEGTARIDWAAEQDGAGAGTLAAAAVLLIERNLASHALMRMLLTPETRSIDIAISADDAIARMKDGHFDHIVIEGASVDDGMTPAIDIIRAIVMRAGEMGARTSLLAAPTETLGAAQLFAAGTDQVILKPIGAGELIAALKSFYEAGSDAPMPPVSLDAAAG